MQRGSSRRIVIWSAVALGAGILVALTSLNDRGQAEEADTGASDQSMLRFAIAGDENNFTPYTITYQSGATQDILNLLYDTLLYSPNDARPEPWLASEVSRSEDARQWTFRVRPDVRWHDGRMLTPEDVKFTFEYFATHEQGRYSHHVNDLPTVERVEIVGDDQVRFTCSNPCPTFDIDPGADLPILPKHIWQSVKKPARHAAQLPVGSGPYRLVQHVSDQFYRLRANSGYFKGRPRVDEIRMPIIKEPTSMFLALLSGEVDAVSRLVPPESIDRLKGAGIAVIEMPAYASVQINMNAQRAPFDIPAFRKALNLATDTSHIAQTLLLGTGRPGVETVLDPDSPFAAPLKHRHDAAAARQILEELGFRDRDQDGVREAADGEALSFEILVSSLEAREVRAAELFAADLASIGVQARVLTLDPATVNARRQPRNKPERVPHATLTGDYDMYLTSWTGGHFHFDPDGLLYLFHCPGETGFGAYVTGYCNSRFDQLVERASVLGFEERKPLLEAAQRVLFEDPPVVSLYFPAGAYAYRQEAYAEWAPEIGHGIFHKRSFLVTGEPDTSSGHRE